MDYLRLLRLSCTFLTFTFLFFLSTVSVATPDQAGWTALWNNQFLAAEQEFEKVVQADEGNMSAWRGLMMARSALGRDTTLEGDLDKYRKGAPHSDYDLLLLSWLDSHNSLSNKGYYETLAKFAKKIAESKDLDLVDRRMTLDALRGYYRLLGQTSEVEKTSEKLNRITDWRILGPFDNTAGSGHIKEFIDIEYLPAGAEYVGKFGQQISWFNPQLVDLGGDVAPLGYFYQKANTTGYARTQIRLKKAGRYLLSMGYEGDMDVHLNGTLIAEVGRSGGGGEVIQKLVDLPSGWTNVTCKVSNRDRYAGFTFSLSNADGSPIKDLEVDPFMDGHVVFDPSSMETLESGMLARIKNGVAEDPTNVELAFWNLQRERQSGGGEELIDQCKAGLKDFGEVALIRLAVLEIYESRDMATDRLLRETMELAPNLCHVKLMLADGDMEKKRFKAARTLAEEVLEEARDCGAAHKVLINSLISDQLWSDLKEAAYKASTNFSTESFPYLAYARYEEEMGNKSDVRKYRKRALKNMLPGSRREMSFLYDWEKEDYKEAKDSVKKLVEADPSSSWKWNVYIYTLLASENYEEAFKVNRSCLASFPQDVGMISTMANYVESGYVLSDDDYREVMRPSAQEKLSRGTNIFMSEDSIREMLKEEAAFILLRAINSDPGNLELRERVANLQGRKPYRTILPDPDVAKVEAMKVEEEEYPGEDSVILLNQKRRLVFEPGVSLLDHVLAVQILNSDGVEIWENYDIPYGMFADIVVLKMSILKNDGSEEEGRQYLNKLMFPDLEAGDLLLVHYQTTQIATGKLYNQFWDQFFFASGQAPVVKSEYRLFIPPDQEIQHKLWNVAASGEEGEPLVKNGFEGFREYRWTLENQPRAGREILEPDVRLTYPWLDLSTILSWDRIAAWYLDMSEGQKAVTPDVQAKAEELTLDCETPEEKISAIFEFVANSINYESVPFFQSAFVPRLPGEVLQDGFGDCKDKSCLMIAMLQAVDVKDLHFALVTPGAPSGRPFLPSPRFNHAIVCRESWNGDLTWFDPTLEKVETGQVPGYLGGTLALVIDEESDSLAEIPREDIAIWPYGSQSRLDLGSEGAGMIHQTENFGQIDQLATLRRQLAGEDEEELVSYKARILAIRYPGVVVDSVLVEGLDPGQGTVQIRTGFQVPDFGILDQDILSVKIPWSSQLTDIYGTVAAERNRETPLDLKALALCETDEVLVKLPGSLRLERLPEGVHLEWKGCEYSTTYADTTGGLVATRSLHIGGDMVSLKEYPGFKDWFDKVRRDLGRTHHLRVN